jgi:predicted dehydrogenase
MLKVGLVGLGFMGRGHLACYTRLEQEAVPVKLVAVCDVDPSRLDGRDTVTGNIGTGNSVDFSAYARYSDIDEMLQKEELDCVDIALPTFLHAKVAIAAMQSGCHVLCEKPMALSVEQCEQMMSVANTTGKMLMIAHCLRFWPAYEYLKDCVDSGRMGTVVSAYFFRGGSTPRWSWQNWMLSSQLSGGCLLDQHVHDVDTVNWLFGMPDAVTTNAVNVIEGSGYDAVSTRYIYAGGKVVCTEDDWTINGEFGFNMAYRVNFKHGSVHFSHDKVTVYPEVGGRIEPELPADDGYYREISYFIDCIVNGRSPARCSLASTRDTIAIALTERESADRGGVMVRLRQA